MSNINTYFIIPAYNEEIVIGSVVQEIQKAGYSPIVVDDCSSDKTYQKALESGATALRHPINLGQGAALQTGIEYALLKGGMVFVTFDADGQHSLTDAILMIEKLQSDDCDVLIGSRFLGKKAINIQIQKIVILKLAALINRFIYGVKMTDAHNGLRVFNKKVAQAINLKQNRMAHASEILGQVNKFRLSEWPVTVRYTAYSIAKGQKITNAFDIIIDLFVGKFFR